VYGYGNALPGQVRPLNCARNWEKKNANIVVQMKLPINPSYKISLELLYAYAVKDYTHVFLGDNWKKGALMNFFPRLIPQKYAETSFIIT
jgi:hypothetical protein